MCDLFFERIDRTIRNFVFIGESGSGKSLISANLALALSDRQSLPIDYFDLDQSKPLFRSRDYLNGISRPGLTVHFKEQFLDVPAVASGIIESLTDPNSITILDAGGNLTGVTTISQFSHTINTTASIAYLVINPYRPWSDTTVHLQVTLKELLRVSRLIHVEFLSNPTLGTDTTAKDVVDGHERLIQMLAPATLSGLCVPDRLLKEIHPIHPVPLFPVKITALPCQSFSRHDTIKL